MDTSTLLARQMELHTSVRHPPKTPADLVRFRGQMHHYKTFFSKLKWISQALSTEVDTAFQCLMYISLGGIVSFDKQHQDGSVPMHQAKVLARDSAIQLEPALRKLVPHEELMVYVGASKDLRTTLRVKVEDGNDLVTAEKSVDEAVQYLDFIYTESSGDPDTMFAFYMVEDEQSLYRLLEASSPSPLSSSGPGFGSTFSGTVTPPSSAVEVPLDPLPPMSELPSQMRSQCARAQDLKTKPLERITAAQTVTQWLRAIPSSDFLSARSALMGALDACVSVLVAEKRSALCRIGCETVSCVMGHISNSPQLFTESDAVLGVLARWVVALCKGVYVTVATIAAATDHALRDVFTQSHGSVGLVKALLSVFERATQTELRRKCLGYMCLSVSAADGDRRIVVQLARLLGPISQKSVNVGDSPSRKMARALVAVLRLATGEPLRVDDEKVERLVEAEMDRIRAAMEGGPRSLETLLFENDNFMASMKRLPMGQRAGAQRLSPNSGPSLVSPAEPGKYVRVGQHGAAMKASGIDGSSPPPRERKSRMEAGVPRRIRAPSVGGAAPVYETNDSLVAPRWSVDMESEPGLSYPSMSTTAVTGSGAPVCGRAAPTQPRQVGTNRLSTSPMSPPGAAKPEDSRVRAHERRAIPLEPASEATLPAEGNGSLPRMSPSLQRKIAQTRTK